VQVDLKDGRRFRVEWGYDWYGEDEDGIFARSTFCTIYQNLGVDDDILAEGEAFCHPKDKFVKEIGRKKSLAAAISDFTKGEREQFWAAYRRRKVNVRPSCTNPNCLCKKRQAIIDIDPIPVVEPLVAAPLEPDDWQEHDEPDYESEAEPSVSEVATVAVVPGAATTPAGAIADLTQFRSVIHRSRGDLYNAIRQLDIAWIAFDKSNEFDHYEFNAALNSAHKALKTLENWKAGIVDPFL
jgi:hypothetical protein